MILQNRLESNERHSGIEVIRHYEELPWIECSLGKLNQVFMSLLNNAIDALEEAEKARSLEQIQNRPRIWIRTEKLNSHFTAIHIKDNGSGIPPQIHHQIFNPFFTTKPVGKGTGLGLSISYQIIESHGGRIIVASKLTWGTEFSIELSIAGS